jgi:putative ABC transport system permease protein
MVMRTTSEPARFAGAVKREFQSLDSRVALVDPIPLEALLDRVLFARPRFSLLVLGIFACAGVVLVALGVYGVLAYTVSQQTREIAIRMAIGGEHRDVLRMVIGAGFRLVGIGVLIGFAASFATNRLLTAQLFNTSPRTRPR